MTTIREFLPKKDANEKSIVHKTRTHWLVFMAPSIFFLLTVMLGIIVVMMDKSFIPLFIVTFIFPLLFGLIRFIRYLSNEYIITNTKVLRKKGFIDIETVEVFLDKIEGVDVQQSYLGKLLNYGNILIRQQKGIQPFFRIHNPLLFKNKLEQQILIFTKK